MQLGRWSGNRGRTIASGYSGHWSERKLVENLGELLLFRYKRICDCGLTYHQALGYVLRPQVLSTFLSTISI